MKTRFKKASINILFFINIVDLVLLTCSNLAHVINPADHRWIALTGLLFPLLILLTAVFTLCWFFIDRLKGLPGFLFMLISIPVIIHSVAFHPFSSFNEIKQPGSLRIVTWNVALLNYETADSAEAAKKNQVIFDSLQQLNADVICLQEFFTSIIPGNNYNFIDAVSNHLHYPYHYFSYDRSQFDGAFYAGSIIFSKYKIVDSNKIVFPGPFPGSVIQAGILISGDTINIVTTRLQSVHFGNDEYEALNEIKNASPEGLHDTRNIVHKLRYGYTQRAEQVKLVRSLLNENNRPLIFTGDLNDVPASYTYSFIRNNLNDAWLSNGFGIGRTFRFISPTLRIDYIFYDERFDAIQTTRIKSNSSDHYGVVTDLVLKKN